MSTNNTLLKFDFLSTNMLSYWNRASMCSNICTLFATKNNHPSAKGFKNLLSSIINECIEISIKHGMNKQKNYSLHFEENNNKNTISLHFYLLNQQVILLKSFIKKIKSINDQHEFEKFLFKSEFSELGFSIYSLINIYKGNLKIQTKKKNKTEKF